MYIKSVYTTRSGYLYKSYSITVNILSYIAFWINFYVNFYTPAITYQHNKFDLMRKKKCFKIYMIGKLIDSFRAVGLSLDKHLS